MTASNPVTRIYFLTLFLRKPRFCRNRLIQRGHNRIINIYLKVLQNKIHTLIHGEDGFALALTIALWPALVLMVSGVYVTGESIRQRIILQNAADAAAYAGALVQADSMSRIAVLNKMLAWTYVQANQMEMDYTVYNWLRK